jgi:predicted Zn-dependent protease
MTKKIMLTVLYLMLSFGAFADSGVVIEAKGSVTINQGGKAVKAQTGAQFADGSIIDVANGGSATLMFSSGSTKKLASGEKYTAAKAAPGQSSGTPLVKGIAMAYNDATKASKGPSVHAMVKAAPGRKVAAKCDTDLTPERAKQMNADLKQVNDLGLDKDGSSLMNAQIFYKYGQNQKMVDTLLPLYKSQNPPSEMVKNLLALGFDKLGKSDEAAKYRK